VRNLISVVLPQASAQVLATEGLKRLQLDSAASALIAGALGLDLAEGQVVAVMTQGTGAPALSVWSRKDGSGRVRHYLNVLITLQSSETQVAELGAIFEVGGQAIPRLVHLSDRQNKASLMGTGNDGFKNLLVQSLVTGLLQAELDKATTTVLRQQSALTALGMRTLGEGAARLEGAAEQGNWAQALSIDFVKN